MVGVGEGWRKGGGLGIERGLGLENWGRGMDG